MTTEPTHTTANGRTILIKEMADAHLLNTIRKIEREHPKNDRPDNYEALVVEAGRRGLLGGKAKASGKKEPTGHFLANLVGPKSEKAKAAAERPFGNGQVFSSVMPGSHNPEFRDGEVEAARICRVLEAIGPVTDEAANARATDAVAEGTKHLGSLDKLRKKWKEPFKKAADACDAAFKVFTVPLAAAVEAKRDEMRDYLRQKEADKLEAQQANEEAARSAPKSVAQALRGAPALQEVPEGAQSSQTDAGTTQQVKRPWTYEVAKLADVPRTFTTKDGRTLELLVLDDRALKEAIKAGARNPDIPGIHIFQDVDFAIKG